MEKTVAELAEFFGGKVIGEPDKFIRGVSSASEVNSDQITFAENEKFLKEAESRNAGAIVVTDQISQSKCTLIQVSNPRVAFAKSLELFFPKEKPTPGIHPTAVIDKEAKVSKSASVGPYVVIEKGASISDNVVIGANCFIGKDVHIGEETFVYPLVSIYHQTKIGKQVILHSGAILGGDGFGYADDGNVRRKIPQLGNVILEDQVEIGCNSCVDRGTLGATIVKKGTKIDNLVQVAHNDVIGENVLLCAQVGISGSSKLGNNVVLAGQVGIADHVQIGDYSVVGAQGGVLTKKKIPPKTIWSGFPARPIQEWKESYVFSSRLPITIKNLEEKIAKLQEKIDRLEAYQPKENATSKI